MAAEFFCTFAEYLQTTAEALELKAKETWTGVVSDHVPSAISWTPSRSQKNLTHVNT